MYGWHACFFIVLSVTGTRRKEKESKAVFRSIGKEGE